MCLLVQGVKQCRHRCEQEGLPCQGPDRLLQIQCCQISLKSKLKKKISFFLIPIKFTLKQNKATQKKVHQTFPIKVLKRRIPWVSTPACLNNCQQSPKICSSLSIRLTTNTTDKARKLPLTIQIPFNFRNTRSCCCWGKLCDNIYRRED